jgi:hypothetical protein
MNLFDIFISYGREDSKAFAIKLNQELTAQGLVTWFDQEDIPLAVDYQKQINSGIEKAHNFIFIIAPRFVNSPYCLKEIELAIKLNKRIIPVLHVEKISQEIWQERNPKATKEDWEEYESKGLHSSEQNMNPIIKKLNWVYFRESDDFATSLEGLCETINRQKNYVEQHTNLLIRALEWERNQKQTNSLLIGEERQKAEDWLKTKFSNEQLPCIPTDLHCEFICESVKNANNLMTQIFLSYSDKNRDIKEKIRKTLMRESLTVWTNKTDIKTGVAFNEEINKGIEGADNFIYLMSSDSLESEYCQQELAHASNHNKRIIALLIEEKDRESIPSQLGELQFIDLTGYEDSDKYQSGVNKLLGELKKDPSYYEKHKILLVKALKWKGQAENSSLLLRGYNLQQFEAWLKVAKQSKDYSPLPLQEEFITASLNKTEESSLEVFISYSRSDSDLARNINELLQDLVKTTWFDQESIATATDFQQEIYRGIESSDNFLFIISPKSVNSPYCAKEVEYAQQLNKRFVTILHRPLSEEDKQKQPSALASVQYLNFNQHDGDFLANFNELVRTLRTDSDYYKNNTEWSQKASKWKESGQDEALLLLGKVLERAENWLSEGEKDKKKEPATPLQKEFIEASRKLWDRNIKQKKLLLGIVYSTIGLVVAIPLTIAGTILGNLHNRRNVVFAQQGQHITGSSKYRLSYTRPYQRQLEKRGSIKVLNQIVFGIPIKDNNTSIDCIDIGSIQTKPLDGDTSGSHGINFNAPKRPGVYYVFFGSEMQYTCEHAKTRFNSTDRQSSPTKSQTSSIGVVIVGNFVDIIFHWKDVQQASDDNISRTVMSISRDNGLFVALSEFSLKSSDKVTRDPKPIPYPDGTIVRMRGNPAVFLLKGKKRHFLSDKIFDDCKYNERIKDLDPPEVLPEYPEGKPVSRSEKCWPWQSRAGAYFAWKNATHLGFYNPNKSNSRGAGDLIAYCTFRDPESFEMYQSAVEVDNVGHLTDNQVDPLQSQGACPMPLPLGYFTWKGASYYSMGKSKYCLFPTKQEFVDHKNRRIKDKEPIFGDLRPEPDKFMSLSGHCGK